MRPFYLDSEFIDVLNTLERLHMVLYKEKNHCKLRLKVNMELLFTS